MKHLKELRLSRGLSQADMASQLGMVRRNYIRYETGDVDPPLSKAVRLAEFFNVSVDYLIGLSDDPERR